MPSPIICRKLLASSSLAIVAAAASIMGGSTEARADQICTANENTSPNMVSCVDSSIPGDVGATASFSEGGYLVPTGYGRLAIMSGTDLNVSFDSGQINAGPGYTVYAFTYGGALTYTSTGTAVGNVYNTTLNGFSVQASTGNIISNGIGAVGLASYATNGNNVTTATSTIVSGTGSRGIFSYAVNGDNVLNTGTVIATGDKTKAVRGLTIEGSTCGSNTVNVTGDVSASYYGVEGFGCGASTINVYANNTVSNSLPGFAALFNSGTTVSTTTVQGTVRAAYLNEVAMEVYGSSSVTTVNAQGTVLGRFQGFEGDDTVTIEAGGTWSFAGDSDFGGGNDAVINSGTIDLVDGAGFANLESFTNNGTMNLSSATLTITQPGFANQGSLRFQALSSTVNASATFINAGNIALDDGQNGILTINGDYAALPGASLSLDAAGGVFDHLVIDGAVSGTTSLLLSGQGSFFATPTALIETSQSTDNAFVLATTAMSPLVDWKLTQSGTTYYIASAPSALAYQPLIAAQTARELWFDSAQSWSDGVGAESGTERRDGFTFHGQVYLANEHYGAVRSQSVFGDTVAIDGRSASRRRGAQGTLNFSPVGRDYSIGLTGGYQAADTEQRALAGGAAARGYNIGLYGRYGRADGPYADLLIKHDRNSIDLTAEAFGDSVGSPDAVSNGVAATGGARWTGQGFVTDLSAGVAYVSTRVDDFDTSDISYDFNRWSTTRAHATGRIELSGSVRPFAAVSLFHEFEGRGEMELSSGAQSGSVRSTGRGTWGRFEGGIRGGGNEAGAMIAGWLEAGNVRGAGVKVGVRF